MALLLTTIALPETPEDIDHIMKFPPKIGQ
jgi:hypothetical protein